MALNILAVNHANKEMFIAPIRVPGGDHWYLTRVYLMFQTFYDCVSLAFKTAMLWPRPSGQSDSDRKRQITFHPAEFSDTLPPDIAGAMGAGPIVDKHALMEKGYTMR